MGRDSWAQSRNLAPHGVETQPLLTTTPCPVLPGPLAPARGEGAAVRAALGTRAGTGRGLTSRSKLFRWVWMLWASSAGTPRNCFSFELPVSLITMAKGTIHLTHFSMSHH